MTIVELIILLLIAAICGSIGQMIAGYSLGGWIISIGVGLIGAVAGKWLAVELGFSYLLPIDIDGEILPIVWSIIGSTLFVLTVGILTRRS